MFFLTSLLNPMLCPLGIGDNLDMMQVQGEHVGGQTDGYNNGWLLGSLQSISLEPQTYDVLLKARVFFGL